MRNPTKDPRMQQLVMLRHQEDRPRFTDYDEWCQKVAVDLGIEPDDVQEIIARQATRFKIELQRAVTTEAQSVANMLGLDQVEIVKTVKAMLSAEETVVTPSGQAVKRPDNRVRIQAAKLGMSLHGMSAPEQINVAHDHKHEVRVLTAEELEAKNREVDAEIARIQRLLTPGTAA